jgi:hypothetical protein
MQAGFHGILAHGRTAKLGRRRVAFAFGAALALLTLTVADALAQPDPFRPSAPRAASQARPPGASPGGARLIQPEFSAPAGYAWAIDRRTSCHVMLPVHLAAGIVHWTGRCVTGMAYGDGTLTVEHHGAVARCSGAMRLGRFETRGHCPSAEL